MWVPVILILALLFVVGGLFSYCVGLYNSLIQVKNNVEKAFKNIDVLLQQRHDELIKLFDVVKGYMKHERQVLETITALRSQYRESATVEQKTQVENLLNKTLGKIMVTFEAYPNLKANTNFMHLQQRVTGLESAIADRREFFNDSVNVYNIQIERFPELIMAAFMRLKKYEYLEVPEESKQDVSLNFDDVNQGDVNLDMS